MPLVKIMGLELEVSLLRLIGEKQYIMEDLLSFKFPHTSAQLKLGMLDSLINGLSSIELRKVYILLISMKNPCVSLDLKK